MDKYLKATEVRETLQVSEQVMSRLLHSGKLRGVKFGGLWKVSEKEVERFLRDGNAPIGVDFLGGEDEE